ncbi:MULTISPECIES: hypothetical protein [Actinoalloteichus]|uniref:Pyruvate phosphate dikinase-like protein n=1 Tax=Actinoalloteichus fjordicus TaxID=1612552 RepID=A0AAC9PRR8_9PSEU|nr:MULTISPECIES: hypothetical protein [Actinoalloteichus]APU14257.1 pyruvate phosphate dikinase-like protein [Actinoalloteichus fjordicus]APU20227.1 pyruvate phosphate dikinase-like protein [Actinoalloteichus sp. GBA129-24]
MDADRGDSASGRLLVLPITESRCREARYMGAELAVQAGTFGRVANPGTVVLSGPMPQWRADRPSRSAALEHVVEKSFSVRAWLVIEGEPDRRVGPVLNNLDADVLSETLVELVMVAAGMEPRADARLVVAVQRFVDVEATVLAVLRDETVRLRTCWGLAEAVDGPPYFDELWLTADGLRVLRERVVDKPIATRAAFGGTEGRSVPRGRRRIPVLDPAGARLVATLAAELDAGISASVEWEFGLLADEVVLLSCPPTE